MSRFFTLCFGFLLTACSLGGRSGSSAATACETYLECVPDRARGLFSATACGQTAVTRAACEQACERALDALAQTGTTCVGSSDVSDSTGGAVDGGMPKGREDDDAACSDGRDNDGDGYFDCVDYSCSRNPNITVCNSTPPSPTFESTDVSCSDGVDNDQDGYLDCDDFDCSRNSNVTVCASANETCSECVDRVSSGACFWQSDACGSNVSCQAYIQCLTQCPSGNPACYTTCRDQEPSGAAKYDALTICLDPVCGTKC